MGESKGLRSGLFKMLEFPSHRGFFFFFFPTAWRCSAWFIFHFRLFGFYVYSSFAHRFLYIELLYMIYGAIYLNMEDTAMWQKELDAAYKCNVCHPPKPIQKSQICSVCASLCRGVSNSFCYLTVYTASIRRTVGGRNYCFHLVSEV